MSARSGRPSIVRILMAVAAILGALFLAAYLVDSRYHGYGPRFAVTEGLTIASPIKGKFSNYWAANRSFPDESEFSELMPNLPNLGVYIKRIQVEHQGKITITYKAGADADFDEIAGYTILLAGTPTNDGARLSWDCVGGTMPDEYRPTSCKK